VPALAIFSYKVNFISRVFFFYDSRSSLEKDCVIALLSINAKLIWGFSIIKLSNRTRKIGRATEDSRKKAYNAEALV
jgi:hypothetical protein